jgi:hypothetical protein
MQIRLTYRGRSFVPQDDNKFPLVILNGVKNLSIDIFAIYNG